jgi:hypothetical protein
MPWGKLVRTACTLARAQALNHFLLLVEGPDPPTTSDEPPAPPFNGSVNSLDEVEMTTFRSETTGGGP